MPISRQCTAQTNSLLLLMVLPLERNLWFCCLSRWPPEVETLLITPGLQCKGLSADINFCGCRCACALLCVLWDSKSQFVSLATGCRWPSIFSSALSWEVCQQNDYVGTVLFISVPKGLYPQPVMPLPSTLLLSPLWGLGRERGQKNCSPTIPPSLNIPHMLLYCFFPS